MITLSVILGVLLLGVGAAVIYGVTRDKPAAPSSGVTPTGGPAVNVGEGSPGAPCATNRLGKSFTGADGVVYTCGGPKPYHWLPPG
jgi:hypothetical protein